MFCIVALGIFDCDKNPPQDPIQMNICVKAPCAPAALDNPFLHGQGHTVFKTSSVNEQHAAAMCGGAPEFSGTLDTFHVASVSVME